MVETSAGRFLRACTNVVITTPQDRITPPLDESAHRRPPSEAAEAVLPHKVRNHIETAYRRTYLFERRAD